MFAYAKTKVQISFDQRLCFRYTDSTINAKFPTSSYLLCLYHSVCVRPIQNLNCWFPRAAAHHLSRIVRKPDFCLCENKGADQLRGNREADQRLCFRHSDSKISLLSKSEISSF